VRRRGSLRTLAFAAATAGFGLGVLGPGCKKDAPQSLIVVSLDASDANGTGVAVVEISVLKPAPSSEVVAQKFFDLPTTGLPQNGTGTFEVGVFIPGGDTGSLPVNVAAKPAGAGCMGYVGMKTAKINGGDTKAIALTLHPGNVCNVVGTGGMGGSGNMGIAGMGGSLGTAGMGGSVGVCVPPVGAPPAAAPAPSLTNCAEFDDAAVAGTCDPVADVNNPYINDVAVSPDGQLLATASIDSNYDGVVKLWHLQNNVPTACGSLRASGVAPGYVAFSPDGKYFAVAWNNDYVYVYNIPDLSLAGQSKSAGVNTIWGVGFSADSQAVFSVDWDGDVDGTLHADRTDGTPISQTMLGVDPDFLAASPVLVGGVTTVAVNGYNGNFGIYTWNGSAFTGQLVKSTVASASGYAIRFSRDGSMMAEGTDDGTVRIWNMPITAASAPNGTPISISAKPFALSFSAAGDQLAIGFGSEVDLWSVSARTLVTRHTVVAPAGASGQFVDSTVFSASGAAVIVGEDVCGKFLICSD